MRKIIPYLITALLLFTACGPSQSVSLSIEINAAKEKIWDIITNPEYAKVLGAEFDKGAFMESDWNLGSEVHFKYEPDQTVTSGTISEIDENEYIQIDYKFLGSEYVEKFSIKDQNGKSVLQIDAGPYGSDYEAQVVVWGNWLSKVKELSEAE